AKRYAHSSPNAAGYHQPPVPFSCTNRKALAFKFLAYLGTGFSIPFIAIWWQWY
ncbi:hypothetical protein BDQ12DRAFT_568502, partial [Crucibulum laeve]